MDEPILIQALVGKEWLDYDYCDVEKAARFLGWGDNSKHYRAVDAITREPIESVAVTPTLITVDVTDWTPDLRATFQQLIHAFQDSAERFRR